MINKKQTLQVVGRRNKQSILKDMIRPSPSSTVSSSLVSSGSGLPSGVGGCAGGPESVPKTGYGYAATKVCGKCLDPEDFSQDCYPNWHSHEYSADGYVNTANPVDGQILTRVAEFPALTDPPDGNQFGKEQIAYFDVFTGCADMERRIDYMRLYFDGEVGSEPLVWSPVNQFGDPADPMYYSAPGAPSLQYYYDQYNIGKASTFSVEVRIEEPMVFSPNPNPLGIPDPEWVIQNRFVYYNPDRLWSAWNPYIGMPMGEWLFEWWVQDEFELSKYYIKTGLSNPSMLPIMFTMQQKNPLDALDGLTTLNVQVGNCTLTSLPPQTTNQMPAGSVPFTGQLRFSVTRNVSDPAHSGNLYFGGGRPLGSLGPLNINAELVSVAGGRDFDPDSPTYSGDQDLSYRPGQSYHSQLEGDQDGTVFLAPTTVTTYSAVYFDGLRVVEGTHYSIDENQNIVPTTALGQGAVVEATFVAG